MAYNFAPYTGATHCVGSAQPGTKYLSVFITQEFPRTKFGNIYSCRNIVGGDSWSHHAEGRALDQMVPTAPSGAAIPALGMPVVRLLGPHGYQLGIDHIIYNRETWTRLYPNGKYYSGLNPHKDHLHIGLTRYAAAHLTLTTIRAIVLGEEPAPPPEGNELLPLKEGMKSEDVRMLKDRLNETYPDVHLDISSADHGHHYDGSTVRIVKDKLGKLTGHPEGKEGRWVVANQWNALEKLWIKAGK